MKNAILLLGLLCAFGASMARGDEDVRQVQEELRKRNLYFGDIDGQSTPDLANSLKRYQARKGFQATGQLDPTTAASLNVELESPDAKQLPLLPDVPVLRSDRAPGLPPAERAALVQAAEQDPDSVPIPPPPAEAPPAAEELSPERVTELVENYLRDSETNDIPSQTEKYFAYPVKYFDDGMQGPDFVERDVKYYINRWQKRKYTLLKPIIFTVSPREGETSIRFEIAFNLQTGQRRASGRTNNFWTIRPEDGELKIVAIREERVRE